VASIQRQVCALARACFSYEEQIVHGCLPLPRWGGPWQADALPVPVPMRRLTLVASANPFNLPRSSKSCSRRLRSLWSSPQPAHPASTHLARGGQHGTHRQPPLPAAYPGPGLAAPAAGDLAIHDRLSGKRTPTALAPFAHPTVSSDPRPDFTLQAVRDAATGNPFEEALVPPCQPQPTPPQRSRSGKCGSMAFSSSGSGTNTARASPCATGACW
jgi:hypothetical protein